MLKIVFAGAVLGLGVTAATAATMPAPHGYHYRYRATRPHGHLLANGRCNGISYGTGARSCGTATGGPVGGLNSRN